MSDELRVLAFGAVDGSLWAAALALPGGRPAIVLGTPDAGAGFADGVDWSARELSGDGLSLQVAAADPVAGDAPQVTGSGAPGQTLCRVTGALSVGGRTLEVDCPGTLAAVPALGSGASLRSVSAWFSDAEALCVLAARAAGADGHEADAVTGSLFEPSGWIAVGEPRLSTTYDAGGLPTRAGLELWVGSGDDEFPRRAAAEVTGAAASVAADGLSVQVSPLRCHSRGEDGAGVYVLAAAA